MTIRLKGLTWDHPRATMPLYAAAAPLRHALPEVEIHWDVQPLAGFEARPIAEAARTYDLIIFDHPHVGEVAAHQLFLPVDPLLSRDALTDGDFVGPSLATYCYAGSAWGLPLDAACQVSCARLDLLDALGASLPATWADALILGERARRHGLYLGMAFGGVHALMTLLSLCANQSMPLAGAGSARAFPDPGAAREALAAMSALLSCCAPGVLDWNSIAVQDAMCARDDIVFCPAVYGFVPYARRERARRLAYGGFCGLVAGSGGSTIGGAGLGISAHSAHPEAASDVARLLVDARMQQDVIAAAGGQPARTAAWESSTVNGQCGNFYAATRATIDRAWVRPRFAGYLHFQRQGGELVEACLRGANSVDATLDHLEAAWTLAHASTG